MSLEGLAQLDRRIIERELRRGALDYKEYNRYLASLPDVSGKARKGDDVEAGDDAPADAQRD